eukprot:CAMPEP_0170525942 /NCGR_PEP_ID=MMETSP0209-20121228/11389_1 /TAXON_ID=665100 ORGANISM="Litonotus pictus, Strain P1" /NCGR_SAMPLE_ID=MMETSP0209 /ASSEMBLY_ACC=CAM_ASM_000301 /LENGTH=250 /DNA_ID=CAMNT_0010815477 /DNA_START=60 /DNA_END=809 /DNA_ORIENTATION=-
MKTKKKKFFQNSIEKNNIEKQKIEEYEQYPELQAPNSRNFKADQEADYKEPEGKEQPRKPIKKTDNNTNNRGGKKDPHFNSEGLDKEKSANMNNYFQKYQQTEEEMMNDQVIVNKDYESDILQNPNSFHKLKSNPSLIGEYNLASENEDKERMSKMLKESQEVKEGKGKKERSPKEKKKTSNSKVAIADNLKIHVGEKAISPDSEIEDPKERNFEGNVLLKDTKKKQTSSKKFTDFFSQLFGSVYIKSSC